MNSYNGKTVLLVDDDIDFLTQMRVYLEREGFEVITGESQEEAMEYLKENTPDVVISDLMMEHYDAGFTLAEQVKRNHPEVPVIICTSVRNDLGMEFSLDSEGEKEWIKANAILNKPIRFEQLRKEIDKAFGN